MLTHVDGLPILCRGDGIGLGVDTLGSIKLDDGVLIGGGGVDLGLVVG